MWNAIANAVRGGISSGASVTPPEPTTVYKLGIEGELEGGTIFHYYNAYWYDSHPSYSFYYIDIANIPLAELANYTIDDVEALFSGDTLLGRNDWELVKEPNPNSLGFIGYPTHEYSSSQSIMDSFMSPSFIESISLDVFQDILSGDASLYSKVRILYKEYSGIGCLEIDFPQDVTGIASALKASNWTKINIQEGVLGVTLATESLLGAGVPKTRYYAARCVSYLGDLEPPAVAIPPSFVNLYDSTDIFPNTILPNVLLAYGDVLEPNRLSTTIDRYREKVQVKNTLNPPTGVASELSVESYSDNSINQIVSVQSQNKQIIVKLYMLQQSKPPNPWYDKGANEVISATAKVACYKNSSFGTQSLLYDLTLYGTLDDIQADAESYTDNSIVLNGVSYYTAIHTFKFDVSNVKILLSEAEMTALGVQDEVGVVTDLQYDPLASYTMRSMLFEIKELRFSTNNLTQTRDLSGIIKTGNRVVVPTIGGAIGVGQDASLYILTPEEQAIGAAGSLYLSMKPGEESPDINKRDFTFEFEASMDSDYVSIASPALNFVNVSFDNISGAMSKDSSFRYVSASPQTTVFSGTVQVSVDKSEATLSNSPNIELDFVMLLNGNEVVNISTYTVNTVGTVDTYTFTIDYTHTFTGAAGFTILDSAKFNVRTINKTSGDIATVTVLSGSQVSSAAATYDPNAPTSNPTYLQSPPPPIQRFNQYS